MFKWKRKKVRNVFDLPYDESLTRLSNIVDDVYRIINNKNFVGAIQNSVKLPANATQKDIERIWYGDEVANKLKAFINVFLREEREAMMNILSTLFVTPKEEYRKKSLNEIFDDLATFTDDEKGQLLSFFTPAR